MINLSAHLLVGTATAFVGVGELSASERGPVVDLLCRGVGQPNDMPWSTAFVSHVGYWSHYDHGADVSSWPLPRTGDANRLCRIAEERRIIRREPAPYDLFALWSPARREFVRSGIIVTVGHHGVLPDGARYFECTTLEGDTNERMSARGNSTRRVKRYLSFETGDRFIRWLDLDASGLHGQVGPDVSRTNGGVLEVVRAR